MVAVTAVAWAVRAVATVAVATVVVRVATVAVEGKVALKVGERMVVATVEAMAVEATAAATVAEARAAEMEVVERGVARAARVVVARVGHKVAAHSLSSRFRGRSKTLPHQAHHQHRVHHCMQRRRMMDVI